MGEGRQPPAQLVVAERTVEAHAKQIFAKLDLAADPDSNRRVRAVLAYLRGGTPRTGS